MSAFNILEGYLERETERELEIEELVELFSEEESDEEEDSKFYSKFAEEGTDAIKTMTGFYINEFLEFYSVVEKTLKKRGRGKKPTLGPLNSFFFCLVMLKHFEKWDKFAVYFFYMTKHTLGYL